MNSWWRAYNDALNNPKLQKLSGDMFKAWFNLMCLASGHDGALPPIGDIAFALRCTDTKAAGILTALVAAHLFDRDGGRFTPHNWNERQYKSDVSTERVKAFRQRKRNVSSNVSETPPEQKTEQKQKIDDGGDARGKSLISAEALELSKDLAKIAGFPSIDLWPAGWMGSPWRVQAMLSEGWNPEIMLAEARGTMLRKRDGPPESVQYFEKAFARAHAKQAAPLPIVEIAQAETVKVTAHGNSGKDNWNRTLDGLHRAAYAEDGIPEGSRPVVALLPRHGSG